MTESVPCSLGFDPTTHTDPASSYFNPTYVYYTTLHSLAHVRTYQMWYSP